MDNTNGMDFFNKQEYLSFDSGLLEKLTNNSSSKGNQEKWLSKDKKYFIKEPFRYQNIVWADYKVELMAESIITQLDVETGSIRQEFCTVDGKPAVCSVNFRTSGYKFLSFHRILEKKGLKFADAWFPEVKFQFIINTVLDCFGLDITNYILDMVLIDTLVGNEDRHLNNFGVFSGYNGITVAKLFDYGLGLFEHDARYRKCNDIQSAVGIMECKPFNQNPVANINWLKREHPGYLQKSLPDSIRIKKGLIPSSLGKAYLDYIFSLLEVEVCYE